MSINGKKITYKWRNLFQPTPKNISRILLAIKAIIAAVATSAYIMHNSDAVFWLFIGGTVLDQLAQFIGHAEEEIEDEDNN